jgi:hypothetical protein
MGTSHISSLKAGITLLLLLICAVALFIMNSLTAQAEQALAKKNNPNRTEIWEFNKPLPSPSTNHSIPQL